MHRYVYILLLLAGCTTSTDVTPSAPDAALEAGSAPAVVEMSDPLDPVVLSDRAAALEPAVARVSGLSAYQERLRAETEQREDVEWENAAREAAAVGWRRTRRQGCQLARMGISEDSRPLRFQAGGGTAGGVTEDVMGIAHVVTNSTRLSKNWLGVMHRLSPHVGRQKELTRPRQKWTSTLPCRGTAKPEGWDEDKWSGEWETASSFWEVYRESVIARWLGGEIGDMPGRAIAWGCRSDERRPWCTDPARARARGLCELPGYGERNGFWAKPGNGCALDGPTGVVSAAAAAGRS